MPPGTDAIVPADQAEPDGSGHIELIEPVAVGLMSIAAALVAEAGATLVAAGTCLTPRHLGLAALAGVTGIAVVRRPRVRLVIGGQPRSGANEGNRLMLHALIARDGGLVIEASLAEAFGSGADIIVLAGSGGEDQLASAVALCRIARHSRGRANSGRDRRLRPDCRWHAGGVAACSTRWLLVELRAVRRSCYPPAGRTPARAALRSAPSHDRAQDRLANRHDRDLSDPSASRWSGRTKRILCRDRVEGSRCGRWIYHRPRTERGLSGRRLGQRLFL